MCEDTRNSDIGDAVVVNEDVFNNNQRGNLFFIFVCGSIVRLFCFSSVILLQFGLGCMFNLILFVLIF